MNAFALYGIFVLLMILGSLLVAYNFLRYRFKGDLTGFFILIYALLFVASMIATIGLLQSSVPVVQSDFL